MTSEQRDIALIVYLSLAWTSSWTNSWVASNESSMLRVIRSRDSSPFTTVQWCFFNVNQKRFWTNSRVYTMNVMFGGDIENVPLIDIEYWWFLGWTNRPVASHFQWKNQQIHCPHKPWYLFFFVVLKKLLNKQMSFLNQKSEFVWTKCHLSGPAQLWSDAFNNWWPRSRYIIWLELWSWCIRNKHCLKLSYLVTPHWTLTTVKWFIWCAPL